MTKEQAINDLEERAKALNRIIKVCEEAKCPAGQYREMEEMKDAIGTVLSMLEEKDKIIDLMAEQLTTPIHDKEWIKKYYENKAKELLNK